MCRELTVIALAIPTLATSSCHTVLIGGCGGGLHILLHHKMWGYGATPFSVTLARLHCVTASCPATLPVLHLHSNHIPSPVSSHLAQHYNFHNPRVTSSPFTTSNFVPSKYMPRLTQRYEGECSVSVAGYFNQQIVKAANTLKKVTTSAIV